MKSALNYTLPVTIFREGEAYVVYTPALDLSSAAKTEAAAKKMFAEAVVVFFEELVESGNLDSVLKELGWTKKKGEFAPPKVVKHALMDFKIPAAA